MGDINVKMLETILPPDGPIDFALLDRYLANAATDAECRAVERWAHGNPAHVALIEVARTGHCGVPAGIDVARALERLRRVTGAAALDAGAQPRVASNTPRVTGAAPSRGWVIGSPGLWPLHRWIAYGATAGALVVAARYGPRAAASLAAPGAAPAHTYATRAAQRATVRLADGTRVTLAPQTTLTIPAGFGRDTRTLDVRGEALFDVARAAGHPFVVRTGGVTARVLGTSFLVRHYDAEREVRVAVLAGRIATTARPGQRTGARVLTPGMVAHFTDSSGVLVDNTALRAAAWVNKQLVFDDARVGDVLDALGRWYGVTFRVTDPALAERRITATLALEASDEVFRTLELLLGVRATAAGEVITLASPAPRAPGARSRRATDGELSPFKEVGR